MPEQQSTAATGWVGHVLAGHRIDALVGEGGMGVVYRATHLRLHRTVALKVLPPALAADDEYRRRFEREAAIAASLEHPNVVPIYDAGHVDDVLYLSMRYVDGEDLGVVLQREGPLAVERVCALLGPVADALDAVHEAGLVHRDVKPANILIAHAGRPRGGGHVYLCDFGIAKGAAAAGGEITSAGLFLGTLHYASPEQIEGRWLDGRSDQYGLACLAFRSLTGQVPYPRTEASAVIYAHLAAEPPRPSRQRPDLPAAVDDVVARATAKHPDYRFPSCTAFVEALRAAGAPRRPRPGPPMPPGRWTGPGRPPVPGPRPGPGAGPVPQGRSGTPNGPVPVPAGGAGGPVPSGGAGPVHSGEPGSVPSGGAGRAPGPAAGPAEPPARPGRRVLPPTLPLPEPRDPDQPTHRAGPQELLDAEPSGPAGARPDAGGSGGATPVAGVDPAAHGRSTPAAPGGGARSGSVAPGGAADSAAGARSDVPGIGARSAAAAESAAGAGSDAASGGSGSPGARGAERAGLATPTGVPAPVDVRAGRTAADHSITVTWTPGGPQEVEYKISRLTPEGRWHVVGRTRSTGIVDGAVAPDADIPVYGVVARLGTESSVLVRTDATAEPDARGPAAPEPTPVPDDRSSGASRRPVSDDASPQPDAGRPAARQSTTAGETARGPADPGAPHGGGARPAPESPPARDDAANPLRPAEPPVAAPDFPAVRHLTVADGGVLLFDWPPGITEAMVVVRQDGPPVAPTDPAATAWKITNMRYQLDGGLLLPASVVRPCHVAVASCRRDGGHLVVAPCFHPTARTVAR